MKELSLRKSLIKLGIGFFFAYSSVAMALPTVSLFVKGTLQMPNWLAGVAVGTSFLATIISRKYAGSFADTKSSKKCFINGFFYYMAAAAVCMLAAVNLGSPAAAFIILIIGRLLLGLGESMTTVGFPSWHMSYLGAEHSGAVFAVMGMGMYGAYILGAPIGLTLYNNFGFYAVMAASFIAPIIGVLMYWASPEALSKKTAEQKSSFKKVLRRIWKEGLAVTSQGIGFALLGAFITLYFRKEGWPYANIGLSLFGIGFVISRILFGHLPDKIGGIKVAFTSLIIVAIGQCLLWLAPHYSFALIGALFTGLGCSMVYPAMGVEVVRKIETEHRSTAIGGFALFQDIAYGFSAPIGGIIADKFGYAETFLFGFVAALAGIILVFPMLKKSIYCSK